MNPGWRLAQWWWAVFAILGLLPVPAIGGHAEGGEPGGGVLNVLLLDAQDLGRPFLMQFQDELRTSVAERNGGRVSLFIEGPDIARFSGPDHLVNFERAMQYKYASTRVDLIVASSNMPLDRLLEWRRTIWKSAPLVIGLLDPAAADRLPSEPGVTALLWVPDVERTMGMVRSLFPKTRRVVLIGGEAYGDPIGVRIRRQLEARQDVQVGDTELRPLSDLDDFVAALPEDTVVFYSGVYRDTTGQGYQPRQVLESLSEHTRRPIVGLSRTYIDHGLLGGAMVDIGALARQVAEVGLQMRRNPTRLQPPMPLAGGGQLVVDYRQARRWDADLDRLPPSTTVLFRPPSLWEAHRGAVLTAAVIGTLLSIATAALLLERSRRRRAEFGLKRLSGRLLSSQESERDRIAKDLHDDVNQRLALLALGIDGIAGSQKSSPTVTTRARILAEETRQLSSDVHGIAQQLRPPQLGSAGLPAAFRALAVQLQERTRIRIDIVARDWPKAVPDEVEIVLYRIGQEALQNVVKHSGATSVRLLLVMSDGVAELSVVDDGTGFDPDALDESGRLGLMGMKERVALVGGRLEVESTPGAGTWLSARVPVHGARRAEDERG